MVPGIFGLWSHLFWIEAIALQCGWWNWFQHPSLNVCLVFLNDYKLQGGWDHVSFLHVFWNLSPDLWAHGLWSFICGKGNLAWGYVLASAKHPHGCYFLILISLYGGSQPSQVAYIPTPKLFKDSLWLQILMEDITPSPCTPTQAPGRQASLSS